MFGEIDNETAKALNIIQERLLNMKPGEIGNVVEMLKENNVNVDDVNKLVPVFYALEKFIEDRDLFVDFDENVSHVGEKMMHDFRIGMPFEITVSSRIYNGDYGKGSTFSNEKKLNLKGNVATLTLSKERCTEASGKSLFGTIDIVYRFTISDEEKKQLKMIVSEIENEVESKYNESHYNKKQFDPRRYGYTDIIINDNEYELLNSDKRINVLLKIFRVGDALNFYNVMWQD